ncbi:MAG TPA: choice-of-anchor V domain-containing protein [Blastocatellia bacterium]|nr:choice-of-anchor V domain-containing protein [Blastocatellia bacterium]
MLNRDRAKKGSLVLFIAGVVSILLAGDRTVSSVHGFSGGPPAGHTDAPFEITCATSNCHTGSDLNSGPGDFTITGPKLYVPGQTYEITVRHSTTDSSRQRWGFQLTGLTGDNARGGTLQSRNGNTAILNDDGPGGNRQYIEHSFAGSFGGQRNQASWTFDWEAPSSDVGAVVLYAAGNQANNNGLNTGDQIYTATHVILSGPPQIVNVRVEGKKLVVTGENFDQGGEVFMDGVKQKKTGNFDPFNLARVLISKKSGKKIARGQTVSLQVRNPDGMLSDAFSFTRPL